MAASKSSTHTIDTESEQDGHVRANCISNCPWLTNMTYTFGILSIGGMTVVLLVSDCSGVHPVSQAVRWSRAEKACPDSAAKHNQRVQQYTGEMD